MLLNEILHLFILAMIEGANKRQTGLHGSLLLLSCSLALFFDQVLSRLFLCLLFVNLGLFSDLRINLLALIRSKIIILSSDNTTMLASGKQEQG